MSSKKPDKGLKQIYQIVQGRAGGFCEVCGSPAQESMAFHHRKLRSRGGKNSVSNLIYIHHGCHNLKSISIHMNPELATEKGHMVPSWFEPSEYPFAKPDGTLVLLQDDGTVIVTKEVL